MLSYAMNVSVCCKGGSLLNSIACAVQEAAVVLVCFSEKYKDSPFCRTDWSKMLTRKTIVFVCRLVCSFVAVFVSVFVD